MRKALWFLLPVSLLSLAAVAAACDGGDGSGDGDGGSGVPSLTIIEPINGSTITDTNVTVTVEISGFELVEAFGDEPEEGEGHIHFFMDAEPPTTPGEPAITAAGTYHVTTMESHTWDSVEPGEHTFSAELVNHDHTPLEEPVVDQVTITVR